jgi:uncharacterized delta-60 repeat protein
MNPKRTGATRLAIERLEDRSLLSAGFLDPTFAGDGLITTNFKTPDSFDQAWDVAIYPGSNPGVDGKVLAVGTTVTRILRDGTWDHDFALARYNPDGTLDASFGQGGKVTTAMGASRDYAFAVELVSTKIVVAGYAEGSGVALARYNDDGSLDTTFGTKGKVLTKIAGGGAGYAMKIDASGKIVVAGVDGKGALAVVRYTANGALDKTFGKGGVATTASISTNSFGYLDLAITPASAGPADAGKIVVVGPGAVARFTTSGVLDTSFDNDGFVSFPDTTSMPSVVIQNDGRIVVSYTRDTDLQLLRINPNGGFDTSFDGDGLVTLARDGYQFTTSVAVQPDGKILVAGDEWALFTGSEANGNFFVARFTAAGEVDTTFGDGGVGLSAENNLQRAGQPNVEMALQENGKIVVSGWTRTVAPSGGYVSDFAVARFLGDDALRGASLAPNPVSQTFSLTDMLPLVDEALSRWRGTGADTSSLHGIDIRITDLGGTTLGLVSGKTIWLDDNAAGWGWFVDPTPWDDSEYTTLGNQGEQRRMDLLTVLAHEIGHLLGYDHEETGVMEDTLAPGTRLALSPGKDATTSPFAADALFALLGADAETGWLGSGLFGSKRRR